MSKEKPLSDMPEVCPICADIMNRHAWRAHMKLHHGWRYTHGGDTLYPPEEQGKED